MQPRKARVAAAKVVLGLQLLSPGGEEANLPSGGPLLPDGDGIPQKFDGGKGCRLTVVLKRRAQKEFEKGTERGLSKLPRVDEADLKDLVDSLVGVRPEGDELKEYSEALELPGNGDAVFGFTCGSPIKLIEQAA